MKTRAYKTGFTLVEIVAVIAIIAILVSMVLHISKRIGDHVRERLCRETITLIGNALEQFRGFGFEYKHTDYTGLTFPLDCNGLQTVLLDPILRDTLYPGTTVTITPEPIHNPKYSGSEVLYFVLNQVPDCRAILNKIDKSLLTNIGTDNVAQITININFGATSQTLPFTRIIDPWGTTLRYDYYPDLPDYSGVPADYPAYRDSAKKTFPVITSAGPDKIFDTADDITNIN
jgi:prepilin-type N-terminal cleavage/methylation domain-containing protein